MKWISKKKLMLWMIVPAGVVAVAAAGISFATPGSGMSSTNLSIGRFENIDVKTETDKYKVDLKVKGVSDVYVVGNVFQPGGTSGWHTHPGPSLITVKSGTITAYDGHDPDCTPRVYVAGTGFVDPGGTHVHLLRNEGSVVAETVVVQLLPAGATRRIDAPDPGHCSF